jgi:hypothetical protein
MKTQKSIKTKKHQKTGAGLGQKQRQKARYIVLDKEEITTKRRYLFSAYPFEVVEKGYESGCRETMVCYDSRDIYYRVFDYRDDIFYDVTFHGVVSDERLIEDSRIEIEANNIRLASLHGRNISDFKVIAWETIQEILDCIVDFEKEMKKISSKKVGK